MTARLLYLDALQIKNPLDQLSVLLDAVHFSRLRLPENPRSLSAPIEESVTATGHDPLHFARNGEARSNLPVLWPDRHRPNLRPSHRLPGFGRVG
jgi:hypothetical protein